MSTEKPIITLENLAGQASAHHIGDAAGMDEQSSAAQSAPAGEREDWSQALLSVAVVLEALRSNDTAARLAKMDAGKVLGEAYAKLKRIRAAWQRTQSAGVPEGWRRAVYHAEECLTGCLASPDIASGLDVETVRKIIADLQAARFAMLAAAPAQPAARQEPVVHACAGCVACEGSPESNNNPCHVCGGTVSAAHDQGEVQRLREALEGMLEYFPEGASDGECFAVDAARAALAASTGQEVKP